MTDIGGTSQWTTTGTSILYNTGNVGTGNALNVSGTTTLANTSIYTTTVTTPHFQMV